MENSQLQTLLNSVLRINNGYRSPHSNWKIRNEYSYPDMKGQRAITKNRIDKIEIGGQQTDLATLLRMFFISIVGPKKFSNSMTFVGEGGIVYDDFAYIADFLVNPNSRNSLMMFGTIGTGKTTMLEAIRRTINFLYSEELSRSSIKVRSCKASELGELMKDEKDKYKELKTCTLLFLDDLGYSGEGEMVNDYGVRRYPVEDLFEHRYDKRLMTICTSNLTKAQLEQKYDVKVFSRFCELFAFMPMTGADFRRM